MNDVRVTRQQLIRQLRAQQEISSRLLDELEELDGARVVERPAEPTMAWCMLPPTTVRWKGEVQLQSKAWRILRAVLLHGPNGEPVSASAIEDVIRGDSLSSESLRRAVTRINVGLEKIQWPCSYTFTGDFVIRD